MVFQIIRTKKKIILVILLILVFLLGSLLLLTNVGIFYNGEGSFLKNVKSILGMSEIKEGEFILKAKGIGEYFSVLPSGRVEIIRESNDQTRLEIQVFDLDSFSLSEGQFYQVWLIKDDFENQFSLGRLEKGENSYFLSVDLQDNISSFSKIIITLQEDNDQSPEVTLLEGSLD